MEVPHRQGSATAGGMSSTLLREQRSDGDVPRHYMLRVRCARSGSPFSCRRRRGSVFLPAANVMRGRAGNHHAQRLATRKQKRTLTTGEPGFRRGADCPGNVDSANASSARAPPRMLMPTPGSGSLRVGIRVLRRTGSYSALRFSSGDVECVWAPRRVRRCDTYVM